MYPVQIDLLFYIFQLFGTLNFNFNLQVKILLREYVIKINIFVLEKVCYGI